MIPESVRAWVDEVRALCQPAAVYWCDGSDDERQRLTAEAVRDGVLIPLNPEKLPGSYLHRSDPSDVARTEHLTFICTSEKDDAGPNNNWMAPDDARAKLTELYRGAMKGRTLYVVPFVMGPVGSPFSKVGVEITDSAYVVLNMRIMTRMGTAAWGQLAQTGGEFTRCLHSLGDLSPDRRFICHFPEDNTIWSVGSGYGGNALLGKKCLALRIASALGRDQGWMAEHMLIVGIQNPRGEKHYVCGAFPSACGKTNLAMMIPPQALLEKGWKVWTIGDDIAWLRPGPDGRLWAVNPEAGFFGVAPGTSTKTNANAIVAASHNTIFTNVALKPDGTVWWEGHHEPPVEGMLDWRGRPWSPGSGEKAAHPNSRFTAPASQCPSIAPEWEDPAGVPISAILFGARRPKVVPLVYEARDWQHGTFLGATLASETTAAATGAVGVLRRDPMAMLPFCGYNMADYFGHWLKMGKAVTRPPRIFGVNWFRTADDGTFLWPGYGDNLRVIEWVLDRCEGRGDATETPIGGVPITLDLEDLGLGKDVLARLLHVDRAEWAVEARAQAEFLAGYGERLPKALWDEHAALVESTSLASA
ncbi:MAG: phosphoenolpyruvate carboxykinase (GTP) [Pseudomonadota bacterium]|nr:phosphoenolpyruvate carboxykinase (GTP) [Pseudomonadota bacterium]